MWIINDARKTQKQSHNLKVIGSNPIPATKMKTPAISSIAGVLFLLRRLVFHRSAASRRSRWNHGAPSTIAPLKGDPASRLGKNNECRFRHLLPEPPG